MCSCTGARYPKGSRKAARKPGSRLGKFVSLDQPLGFRLGPRPFLRPSLPRLTQSFPQRFIIDQAQGLLEEIFRVVGIEEGQPGLLPFPPK